MKELLKKHGHENDGCMKAILEFFYARRGEWVNKAPLSLMQFPYEEKGQRKHYSPETIGRKARLLAKISLLDRKDEGGQAWYRWAATTIVPQPYQHVYKRPVIRNGETVWIPMTEPV